MKTLKFKEYKDLNERQYYTRKDWDEVAASSESEFEDVKKQFYSSYRDKIQVTKDDGGYRLIIDDPTLVINWKWFFEGSKIQSFPIQFEKIHCQELMIQEENFNSFINFPKELIVNTLTLSDITIQNFDHFSPKYEIKALTLVNVKNLKSLKGMPIATEELAIRDVHNLLTYAGVQIPSKEFWTRSNGDWKNPSILLSDHIFGIDDCKYIGERSTKRFDVTAKKSWTHLLKFLTKLSLEEIQFHYSYLEKVFDPLGLDVLEYAMELLEIPLEKIEKDPMVAKLRKTKNKAEDDIGFSF